MMKAARRLLLETLIRGTTLRLFTNDRAPKDGDSSDDYKEPDSGYRPIGLHDSDWKLTGDKAAASVQRFSFTGRGQEIRGWFLTKGSVLIHAERMKEPFLPRIAGDWLEVKAWVEIKGD